MLVILVADYELVWVVVHNAEVMDTNARNFMSAQARRATTNYS